MRSEFAALQRQIADTNAQVQAAHARGFAWGFTAAVACIFVLLVAYAVLLWLVGA